MKTLTCQHNKGIISEADVGTHCINKMCWYGSLMDGKVWTDAPRSTKILQQQVSHLVKYSWWHWTQEIAVTFEEGSTFYFSIRSIYIIKIQQTILVIWCKVCVIFCWIKKCKICRCIHDCLSCLTSGGRLNMKDGLTRYGDSHVEDKTS